MPPHGTAQTAATGHWDGAGGTEVSWATGMGCREELLAVLCWHLSWGAQLLLQHWDTSPCQTRPGSVLRHTQRLFHTSVG